MGLADKIAKQEMKSEYSDGFIDITYYSKDDLSKLSIGDFVKFSGTFYFSTATHMTVDCENNNFDIKVNYTPTIDKNNFNIGTKYQTTFKGIWGSFVADLLDIESSFSEASEYKHLEDYFKEYDDIAQEVDLHSEDDYKSKDLLGKVKDDNSKSILDKLLEQQYWNTELAKENEDLSKKLTHAQGTNRDFKKQVETLSKRVETLTIDRDKLSSQVVDLQDKLNEARNLTEDNLSLSKRVETLTIDRDNLKSENANLNYRLRELENKLNNVQKNELSYKSAEDTIITKYNNLVKTYNQIRNDYICLRDRELKVNIKNIIFQIVKIILLSPLVMFLSYLIYNFLADLFGLPNI